MHRDSARERKQRARSQSLLQSMMQGASASAIVFNSRSCGYVKSAPASDAALPLRDTCSTPITRLARAIGALFADGSRGQRLCARQRNLPYCSEALRRQKSQSALVGREAKDGDFVSLN